MSWQIYRDFKEYTDHFGLITLTKEKFTAQNGVLFTIEYLICYLSNGGQDTVGGVQAVDETAETLAKLEVFPGVTKRCPDSPEPDSMDNMVAHLVFSKLYGFGTFAVRCHTHAKTIRAQRVDPSDNNNFKYYKLACIVNGFRAPRAFWNNEDREAFTFQGWLGRSPGFLGLIAVCAEDQNNGIKPTAWQLFWLWIGQFLGCFANRGNTDARKLPFVVWQALKDRSWFWKKSYQLWVWVLLKQYPTGMRGVYEIYYKDIAHPIRLYSQPVPVLK